MALATLQDIVDQLEENKKATEDTTTSVDVVASLIRNQIEQDRIIAENNARDRIEAARESTGAPGPVSTVGGMASSFGNSAMAVGGGLAGLGAGIAGFMASLAVGSAGLEWIGNDYTGLSDAFASFSDAITNLSPAAMIAIAGAATIAAKTSSLKNLYGLGTASGMTGLGAGISGFLIGLALGDSALSWLDTDYSNLGKALGSFSEAISNLTPAAVLVTAGVAGIAIANTAFGGDAKSLALSMTGVAAGIAGFLGGLVLTDVALGWVDNDYSNIGNALASFSNAIANLSPQAVTAFGVLVGTAITAGVFKVNGLTIAGNLAGVGIGIAAFMGALALGDKGISWIGAIPEGSGKGLVSTFKMFNDAVMALTPESIAALGVIIAGSAAFGSVSATNVMAGMGALGIGISTFMGALALGDRGIGWINAIPEGSSKGLVSTFKIFNDAVMALTPESIKALGVLIAGSAVFGTFGAANVMAGMTAIGVGISGFMAALALGDKGISWIGAIPAGSGKGLVSTFQMFNDAIMALSPDAMKAMAVLMAASPAGALVSVGLPLIGVGLAGFITALAAADVISAVAAWAAGGEAGASLKSLLTNIFEGLSAAGGMDGTDLLGLAGGLTAVAGGLAAFAVGNLAGTLANVGTAILGFFGVDNPFDQIMGLADKADSLAAAGNALEVIAGALGKFGAIQFNADNMNFEAMAEQLGYAIPTLKALAVGGVVEGSGTWGIGETVFPEGGILNPNLKLDEMAAAISKVNYVLGQTTTYPGNVGGTTTVQPNTIVGGTTTVQPNTTMSTTSTFVQPNVKSNTFVQPNPISTFIQPNAARTDMLPPRDRQDIFIPPNAVQPYTGSTVIPPNAVSASTQYNSQRPLPVASIPVDPRFNTNPSALSQSLPSAIPLTPEIIQPNSRRAVEMYSQLSPLDKKRLDHGQPVILDPGRQISPEDKVQIRLGQTPNALKPSVSPVSSATPAALKPNPSTTGSALATASMGARATYLLNNSPTINNITNNNGGGSQTSLMTMPVSTYDSLDNRHAIRR